VAGADVNSKNFGQGTEVSHGETPLHAAAEVFSPRRDGPAGENGSGSDIDPRHNGHNQVHPL
jgi:hypothetical protein